ncbi:MAG: hypothetical protein KH452_03225 [Clostridiales bacterium]|nr:hypothetical protein [Clostridiales bacterium]
MKDTEQHCGQGVSFRIPAAIEAELSNLEEKYRTQNWFGAILAIKDGYEILMKYSCLALCALIYGVGEEDFFRILTNPEKSMSLGDWCNDLLNAAARSTYIRQNAEYSDYCKSLSTLISDTGIVPWRNNTLGHGVMKFSADQEMIRDIAEKRRKLYDFLKEQQRTLERIAVYDAPEKQMELSPFVIWDTGRILMFDSMDRDGTSRYLDCTERCRVKRADILWTEKRKKYYGALNAANEVKDYSAGYISDLDEILSAFHKTYDYEKPQYLTDCVRGWLKKYDSGIFLLSGDRGTGKSAFVYACDELQHDKGSQKIKLSFDGIKTAVRAYYASRTEMLSSDEAVQNILEQLQSTPDDKSVRIRGIAESAWVRLPLAEKIKAYQRAYREICGTDKMLVFVDGIDELTEHNGGLLESLPEAGNVPEGVYLIVTCRSVKERIPALAADFCGRHRFTEQVLFDRTQENGVLLKRYLKKQLKIEDVLADKMAEMMDYRFSAVPLLSVMKKEDIEMLVKTRDRLDDWTILEEYMRRLSIRYGKAYFCRLLHMAVILAETPAEALDLQEVAWLSENHGLTTREIAFLYDLRPLLMEFRDYRGAVYGFSGAGWVEAIRNLYPDSLKQLALEWEQDLLEMNTTEENVYPEIQWNSFLYKASVLGYYFSRLGLKIRDKELLQKVMYVAVRFQKGVQSHQIFRSKRCLDTLFETYMLQLEQSCEEQNLLLCLAVCNTNLRLYAVLGIQKQIFAFTDRLDQILQRYQSEWENHREICIQVISYFSNMICVCGDLYDHQRGIGYYERAARIYGQIKDEMSHAGERIHAVWSSLSHNFIGMIRNYDPPAAVREVEKLLPDMRLWKRGYDDVSLGCLAAMCYKSAGERDKPYRILKECVARIDQLGMPGNPSENEIYLVTQWRYFQCLHEDYDFCGISLQEVEQAADSLNVIIDYIVGLERKGFPDMSKWKPQMMMTAALIQCRISVILSRVEGTSQRVLEHLYTGTQMADKVMEVYQLLDETCAGYDRVSAMQNFINIGAVYASAFQWAKGVSIIEDAMERYVPENETEQKLWNGMKEKVEELRMYGR